VADVPCGGRLVTLALTIRKFVCSTKACLRRIFTERLSDLVQSYARMTNRLSETLQTLGFATSGEGGERFASKLGMQVSGPTLLRRMRTCFYTPPASVSVLGIDDWAWKKGATYGTILVDLQSHKPMELPRFWRGCKRKRCVKEDASKMRETSLRTYVIRIYLYYNK
jgi:hypothetical protein